MSGRSGVGSPDVVVVGGGAVGGWCAWFLRRAGLDVVLLERSVLGRGASSRAAGVVRAQGGTPWTVRLGMWSRAFYVSQPDEVGVDSGFVAQGYLIPAFSDAEVKEAAARIAMQQALGLDVEWVGAGRAAELLPALAPGAVLGGSYAAGDGYLDPPRNVAAYAAACLRDGVVVRERTELVELRRTAGGTFDVRTSAGALSTRRVVLTGGPDLAAVGAAAGVRIWAGGARHQVAVTAPHPSVAPERIRMVFDRRRGLYWRPEDGGVLFGMSNPAEAPGPARDVDWHYLGEVRRHLDELLPAAAGLGLRRVWAATIEYTPDHLPIVGAALDREGAPLDGVTVASAAGHGMMWGPAVARAACDHALGRESPVADLDQLGLGRFDADGRSRLEPDPIALPFPESVRSAPV
jgi:sarcosine oxidase subunit beta